MLGHSTLPVSRRQLKVPYWLGENRTVNVSVSPGPMSYEFNPTISKLGPSTRLPQSRPSKVRTPVSRPLPGFEIVNVRVGSGTLGETVPKSMLVVETWQPVTV